MKSMEAPLKLYKISSNQRLSQLFVLNLIGNHQNTFFF